MKLKSFFSNEKRKVVFHTPKIKNKKHFISETAIWNFYGVSMGAKLTHNFQCFCTEQIICQVHYVKFNLNHRKKKWFPALFQLLVFLLFFFWYFHIKSHIRPYGIHDKGLACKHFLYIFYIVVA